MAWITRRSDQKPQEPALSAEALQAYLVEYQQCLESYRHNYATIWQAGAVFAAISAVLVTFGKGEHIGLIAPAPVIFWYLGIFVPMNRYGEIRNQRLVNLEEYLSNTIPGLDMRHCRTFTSSRKMKTTMRRLLSLEVITRPRVSEVVTALALAMFGIEIYSVIRLLT
jgi:hypothetical protein